MGVKIVHKSVLLCTALFVLFVSDALAQKSLFSIARLKYGGGGDWYNDPSAIPNLLQFIKENTNIAVMEEQAVTEALDEQLFSYPVLFMTGHGRISFTTEEIVRLRHYLAHGGFLYADDDYGMDSSFREMMKKIFPDNGLVELPFSHDIYKSHYKFENGLPKTHEHDKKAPKGYGIFFQGRLVVFYTYETNLSDGWADPEVHGDPPAKREEALKMGTNIMIYVLNN